MRPDRLAVPLIGRPARWTFALVLIAAAFGFNLWLHALTAGRVPFLPFYPAIIIVGFMSGTLPGIVALAVAELCVTLLWLGPGKPLSALPGELAVLLPFTLGTGLSLAVAAAARTLLIESRHTRDRLDVALRMAREAQLRFEVALKGGSIIAWSCDAQLRYTWVYDPRPGMSPQDYLGRRIEQLRPRERYPEYIAAVERVLRTGVSARVPIAMELNGVSRNYLSSIDPVLDDAGRVIGLVGASVDTTDQLLAQQALIRSERQLRSISDALPVLISYVDTTHVYRFNNAAYERWYGRHRDQITNCHVSEVIGQEAYNSNRPYLERALRGELIHFETRVTVTAAQMLDVQITYVPQRERDQVVGVVVLVEDISARTGIEAALRDKEHRWRTMFDAQPECIKVVSPDGLLLDMNPAGLEMIEAESLERVRGQRIERLIDPQHLSGYQALHEAALAGRPLSQPQQFDLVGLRGTRRSMESRSVPLRDQSGQVVAVLFVTSDISERKRTELALREADRRKDEFLATLAHELRNPMAPIRYAAATLKKDASEATLQRARDVIERQSAQMSRLLDDLLDMSRVTRNVIELKRSQLDLRDLLTEATETARPLLANLQHRLTVSIPPQPLWVYGDATRLLQVMGNLIDNAAKYTNAGGSIEIRLEARDTYALMQIRDSGIGLAPEMIPKVFDLFAQVHPSMRVVKGGLGIGLSVVKRLVELHGGTVEVQSEGLNRGSQFTLRLPLSSAPAELRLAEPEKIVPLFRAHPAVLIVDDNRDAAETLAFMLRGEGFPVLLAYDGAQALAAFDSAHPAVVLLDMGLPDMHGTDVARQLRARASPEPLQIIAVTGWGQARDRERSREAGVDLHLVKPVDPVELLRLLNQSLGPDAGASRRERR